MRTGDDLYPMRMEKLCLLSNVAKLLTEVPFGAIMDTNILGKVWLLRMKKRGFLAGFAEWYLDGGALKTLGRTIIIIGIIAALIFYGVGKVQMEQAASAERELRYEAAYEAQQEKEYKALVKEAEKAAKNGTEAPEVPEDASQLVLAKPPKVARNVSNFYGDFFLNYVVWAVLILVVALAVGLLLIKWEKLLAWYLTGGVMKTIGRTLTIIGIIVALVFTSIGVVDMYTKAEAQREEKYATAYEKAQKNELKALQKAAKEAEKAGLEVPEVPESHEGLEVVIEPVALPMDDQVSGFLTTHLLRAIIALVAGVGLGWIVSSIPAWIVALKAAGPRRVIAGAFFWLGAVIAVVFLLLGLVRILGINKSTLPEVGKILFEEYLIWSVIALGSGIAIRWMILKLDETQKHAFESVGLKLRGAGKALFCITLVLFAVLLILTACALVFSKWWLAAGLLIGAVVALACGWVCSLALEALGTTTMIMEPQAKEAEAREFARRNAKVWICPECGTENLRSAVTCSNCSEIKPTHD